MKLFELDLQFGAPGFVLRDRLDMSGHRSGRVLPHINSEVTFGGNVVIGDLSNNQLPGFNGMQESRVLPPLNPVWR